MDSNSCASCLSLFGQQKPIEFTGHSGRCVSAYHPAKLAGPTCFAWNETRLLPLQAAAPLQMLINDVTVSQGKAVSSFAQQLLTGGNPLEASTAVTSSNPLTGIATTPTTPTVQVQPLPCRLQYRKIWWSVILSGQITSQ